VGALDFSLEHFSALRDKMRNDGDGTPANVRSILNETETMEKVFLQTIQGQR